MMRTLATAGGRTPGHMWIGISDSMLASTVVRPVQFHDVWSRSGAVSPERSLALAVLQEALNDLATYRFARRRRGQRLYWQAYDWIAADDRAWPFSFVNLCEAVGLEIEPIRCRVLQTRDTREATLEKAA